MFICSDRRFSRAIAPIKGAHGAGHTSFVVSFPFRLQIWRTLSTGRSALRKTDVIASLRSALTALVQQVKYFQFIFHGIEVDRY